MDGARSWEALHGAAVWCRVDGASSLRVTGGDRLGFVRGRLTAAIPDTAPGACDSGLQLDVRGGALAQVTLHVRERDLHVLVEDGAASWLATSWREAIVFDDVQVRDLTGTLVTYTVQGPDADAVWAELGGTMPPDGAHVTLDLASDGASKRGDRGTVPATTPVLVSRSRRSLPGGVDLTFLSRDEEAVVARLANTGAPRVDGETLDASRIEAMIPRAGTEAGAGVLPQEAGLGGLVALGKGCYLGQETMARVHARGRLRRGLVRVTVNVPAESGLDSLRSMQGGADGDDVLTVEGRAVGRLGSVARHPVVGWVGLAVLRHDLTEDVRVTWRDSSVDLWR